MENASEVFRRRGFNGCSVQDIVEAAGVPKGSFYNHFESKEALAIEALRRYLASLDVGLLDRGSGRPLERLRAHLEDQVARTERTGLANGCMLGNFTTELAGSSEAVRNEVNVAFQAWSRAVASVLAEAQRAGELAARHDPVALADYIIDGLEGASLRTKASEKRRTLEEFVDITFTVLLA